MAREWAICRHFLGGRNGMERSGLGFRRVLEIRRSLKQQVQKGDFIFIIKLLKKKIWF